MRWFFLAFSLFVVAGCATMHQPVPEGYTGPTATITDSAQVEKAGSFGAATQAAFFVVTKVDGKDIYNSLGATRGRYQGRGMGFTPELESRKLPVRPITVEVLGQTYHGAPILALLGETLSVKGVVSFTPEAGARYSVKGVLAKGASSVWIEDQNGEQVGSKISGGG